MPIDPNTGQRLPYPGQPAFAGLPPQAQQAIQALMMQGRMKPPGLGMGFNPGGGLRAGIQAGGPGPLGPGRFGPGLLGPPVGARPPIAVGPPIGGAVEPPGYEDMLRAAAARGGGVPGMRLPGGPPPGAPMPVGVQPGQEIGDVRPPGPPAVQGRMGVPVGQSAMQQMLAARSPVQQPMRPQMPQVPVGQYRHPQAGLY